MRPINDFLLSKLPIELYFMILDNFNILDETYQCALSILNLACTSRSHLALINYWTLSIANGDVEKLKDIQKGMTNFSYWFVGCMQADIWNLCLVQ